MIDVCYWCLRENEVVKHLRIDGKLRPICEDCFSKIKEKNQKLVVL